MIYIPTANPSDRVTKELMEEIKVIAVVGLSPKPERDSYMVASYMQSQGYTVIPVNPGQRKILGQKCYPDLPSIPQAVDMVNVFRRSEYVSFVAQAAVEIKAKSLWLQQGVRHDEAADFAREQGLIVHQDLCFKVEHNRLFGH